MIERGVEGRGMEKGSGVLNLTKPLLLFHSLVENELVKHCLALAVWSTEIDTHQLHQSRERMIRFNNIPSTFILRINKLTICYYSPFASCN